MYPFLLFLWLILTSFLK